MNSRFFTALALACAATLLLVAAALAHAELVESDPHDGGTISTPYTFTATFSEELEPNSSIIVRDSSGDEVASGGVSDEDNAMIAVELPELPPGEYRALWTASTADGHTERGRIDFTVIAAPTPSPTAEPTPVPTVDPTAEPTSIPSAPPTTSASPLSPSLLPSPIVTPEPIDGQPSAGSGDLLIALALAGAAVAAVVAFIFLRGRR